MTLKTDAAAGVRWVGLSSLTRLVLMLVRLSALARLLSPRDFGLAAMVAVVLGYAETYVDAGLTTAVIQKQETDPTNLSTLFWINVATGAVAGLLIFALRTPIALLFGELALAEFLPLAALQVPLAALGRQSSALFRRDLEFRLISGIQVVGDLTNTGIAIVLAFMDHGAWSLVIASVAGTTLQSVTTFAVGHRRWPVRLTFKPSRIRSHLRFGMYETGRFNAGYLAGQVDSFLIARLLGAESLGVYTIARRLTQVPQKFVLPTISKVALSVFARQQREIERMVGAFWTLQKALAYVNLPLLAGLLLVSPLVVPILYGAKWVPAVLPVQLLCVLAMVSSIAGPTQQVRTALGRARFNFHWAWTSGVFLGLCLWLAAGYGLTAVVTMRVAAGSLTSVILIALTMRVLQATATSFAQNLARPALATAVMASSVYSLMAVSEGFAPVARLLICSLVGGLIYLGTAHYLDGEFLRENVRVLLNRRK